MWGGLTFGWIVLRLFVFPDTLAPFTYVLPLLICTWTSDVRLLWAMAGAFALAQSVQFIAMPSAGLPSGEVERLAYVATVFNIMVGAGLAHALMTMRARLELSNRSLRTAAATLRGRSATLQTQAHELTLRNHELLLRAAENQERLRDNQRLHTDLKRSELKYHEFFEHLDEIVLVLQPTTEPAGHWVCVDANTRALCAAGATRDAIVGVSLERLPQMLEPLIRAETLATALNLGHPEWYEVRTRARQYRQIVFPIAGGQVATAALDVTEHRQIEAALRSQDQQKNQFIATLSHELRHPLMPIRFALELLPLGGSEANHARQVIERQVTHIERLIDDLLDLSRIAAGKLRLRLCEVTLTGIVTLAVESVFPDPDCATHRVTTSIAADIGLFVADPDRLVQILTNLVGNAARYTPKGGNIAIHAKAAGGRLTIEVSDNGVGLSARDCERIFDMFTQAHDHDKGLGIGLALVKSLVILHGGVVNARSDGPGCGTTFHIELPLRPTIEGHIDDDEHTLLSNRSCA
jgi:signal transduction histidine kinase